MKKIISFALAMIMLLSSALVIETTQAATKKYATEALESIQTQSGFIPGKNAAVLNNCYGFISKVCEKLYGKPYQEGLYNTYRCKHETGYFKEIKIYSTTSTSMSSSMAEGIRDFFINNAMPGDIIHYGCISSSGTHTVMIQSIDNTKMRIYHSNYETVDYSRSSCHIDTIYWSSFISSPTKNEYYSNGSLKSFNAIFYNKQKSGGLGISINRATNYSDLFYTVTADSIVTPVSSSTKVEDLKLKSRSTTSLSFTWTAVRDASEYYVYAKNNNTGYEFNKTVYDNAATLNNLTSMNSYTVKVRAKVGGSWKAYSDSTSQMTRPPALTKVPTISDIKDNSLIVNWTKVSNVSGYNIVAATDSNFSENKVSVYASGSSTLSKTLESLKSGYKYYVKVRTYKTYDGSKVYSTYSTVVNATTTNKYIPKNITLKKRTTTSLTFDWDDVQGATKYYVWIKNNTSGNTFSKTVTSSSATLNNLTEMTAYSIKIKAYVSSWKQYSEVTSQLTKPKTISGTPTVSEVTGNGAKIGWSKVDKVSGYYIQFSTKSDFSENKKGLYVSGASSLSKTVDDLSASRTYYVRVKTYKTYNGKKICSSYSKSNKFTTKSSSKVPVVTGLKVVVNSSSKMTLSWTKVSGASKYYVYVTNVSKSSSFGKTVTANSTTIQGLTSKNKYSIKVRAYKDGKWSSYCTPVTKTTP